MEKIENQKPKSGKPKIKWPDDPNQWPDDHKPHSNITEIIEPLRELLGQALADPHNKRDLQYHGIDHGDLLLLSAFNVDGHDIAKANFRENKSHEGDSLDWILFYPLLMIQKKKKVN